MSKRVFLVVLDSFGVGEEPDAHAFGDWGVNTLGSIRKSPKFHCPNLARLGLFHLDGVQPQQPQAEPIGAFARLQERSMGKDTTIGHWEIAGVESPAPLPTYPDGFPPEIIQEFEQRTGRAVLCNKPYSGTEVLNTCAPGPLSCTLRQIPCFRLPRTRILCRRSSFMNIAASPAAS